MICGETLALKFSLTETPQGSYTEEAEIDGEKIKIGIRALPRS